MNDASDALHGGTCLHCSMFSKIIVLCSRNKLLKSHKHIMFLNNTQLSLRFAAVAFIIISSLVIVSQDALDLLCLRNATIDLLRNRLTWLHLFYYLLSPGSGSLKYFAFYQERGIVRSFSCLLTYALFVNES